MGYNFVSRGNVGLERSYDDDLTGKTDEFETILDQLRGKQREGDDIVTALDPAAQRDGDRRARRSGRLGGRDRAADRARPRDGERARTST